MLTPGPVHGRQYQHRGCFVQLADTDRPGLLPGPGRRGIVWLGHPVDDVRLRLEDPALFARHAMTYRKPLSPWIATVDLHDFDVAVLAASHEHPVLVDFWADWCSPCLVIAPVLERVVAEYNGAVRLAKLEVDAGENMKLAGHYRVRGFPTIILFSKGAEQGRFSGAHPATYIRGFIDRHLPPG